MAFFTQAIEDGTIDRNLEMSEEEFRNAIIARVMESGAWERHRMHHKDAKVSTISEDGGFSEMEKHAGKKHEELPAISYDSHSKKFAVSCNCGKEKFVFDTNKDTVESEHEGVKMKGIDPYKKSSPNEAYSRESSESNSDYNSSVARPRINYSSQPRNSYKD